MRTCKNPSCNNKFENKYDNMVNVCSGSCAYEYGKIVLQKNRDKKFTELKRKVKSESLKTRKRATKEACHLYIRTRDIGKPCICCGQPLTEGYHAGHFYPSYQNPKIRYNEDNIHGQNLNCNYYSGDSRQYEANLIERIGVDRVNALKAQKGGTVKRTADDYREIEKYYKAKLKLITDKT